MKKHFLFIVLILSILSKLHAGYVIHGISIPGNYSDLKNYTLTFYKDEVPIAAASMHTSYGSGSDKNSIVIIFADTTTLRNVIFPIGSPSGFDTHVDIEVRDFHHDKNNDTYVLCGSRLSVFGKHAFVAVINSDLSIMRFYEYQEANMFYSIWVDAYFSPGTSSNYYVCGTRDKLGVIASIDRTTLQLADFYTTETGWEYHKIIAKQNTDNSLHLVASGRNPECTHIGFTTFDPQFYSMNNYTWLQKTNLASHCVVSDDVLVNNKVILASSYQSTITLNPVTFPVSPLMQIPAYRFNFNIWLDNTFYVQDIGTIQNGHSTLISVAGNAKLSSGYRAWHVYTLGLSSTSSLINNFYGTGENLYEHYKIRYRQGEEYTGGYFQNTNSMRALFGSPLTKAPTCDYLYQNSISNTDYLFWTSFNLMQHPTQPNVSTYSFSLFDVSFVYDACTPFKAHTIPEYAISAPETENEIITFPDRIAVKDTPPNTHYQIYTVLGQLIQTGTTTPDISTAQLSKGIYILRLENGKAFKFVK